MIYQWESCIVFNQEQCLQNSSLPYRGEIGLKDQALSCMEKSNFVSSVMQLFRFCP